MLTVSNNSRYPGEYQTLPEAVAAAAAGDTIMVSGGGVTYSTSDASGQQWYLEKPVHIIGQGVGPGTDVPRVNAFYIRKNGDADPSGTVIEGVDFQSSVNLAYSNDTISDITLRRCRFQGDLNVATYGTSSSMETLLVEECWFDESRWVMPSSVSNRSLTGWLIQNCVFDAQYQKFSGNFPFNGELQLLHCLFLRGYLSSMAGDFHRCMFLNLIASGSQTGTFQDCLAYGGTFANTFPPSSSVDGGGNVTVDPGLASYTLGTAFSWGHDFTPSAAEAGTGEAQMGIGGGLAAQYFAANGGNLPPAPRGPVVTSFAFPSLMHPEGGTTTFDATGESRQ